MESTIGGKIRASRMLLQNQYAYLDDTDAFSASPISAKIADASYEKITADRRRLQNQYAHLNGEGGFSATRSTSSIRVTRSLAITPDVTKYYSLLTNNRRNKACRAHNEIEKVATRLQQQLWRDRANIWSSPPSNPIELLDPTIALELIGYQYALVETLGQYYHDGNQIEVAGIIDNSMNQVSISRKFPPNIRNFTAAHELGHALLHEATGLHRDRPLDGSSLSRDEIECEADKFASYFLMPGKYVKKCFQQSLATDCFFLNEDTSFALTRGTTINLARNCKSLRDLSRILASTESYNGVRFVSLANQFRVSVETMAIRLEELELVNF